MRQTVFLSSPQVWQRGHGPHHPLKPERLQRTHELLETYGAFESTNVGLVPPRPATEAELQLFHTAKYVSVVKALSEGDRTISARHYGFGPGDNPIFDGMYDSEGLKVGSAIQAAELLVSGQCDVAFSYSGGLHHAGSELASGFCVFNDAAVAILWLLSQGKRVAYVDVDVHHGDGVQTAFYDDDRVLTISLHQDPRTLFPGTGFVREIGRGPGEGYCVNVPLPPYTDDENYLWAFREIVPPMLERFEADVLVTQLGVDTHIQDPLANLALTTTGQATIFSALAELASKWLALGGGGYAMDVVPRAWTLAFGVMAGLEWPEELPSEYQARYGGRWLHDQEPIQLEDGLRRRVRKRVEEVVTAVKKVHKLG